MNINSIKHLKSPLGQHGLDLTISSRRGDEIISGKLENKKTGESYVIRDGIADLTYPLELKETDKEFNKKYDDNAANYDVGMKWLFDSFYEKENDVRSKLVAFLKLKSSHSVLNIGCGTGGDSVYIQKKLGKKGRLVNFDLTSGLLKIARKKLGASSPQLEYIRGNGSYLPFADNTFDVVFHFGGINMFSEKKRAIDEMVRVAKKGGSIVFGDESASPWLRNKKFGKIIRNANPLYNHVPPIHMLPLNAQNVSVHYVLGNSFYVISFEKGNDAKLNLDLQIPGKRGGTLRSRYEAMLNNQKF